MIIILEGPDGSGKSTLAKQLSDQLGLEIIPRGKPETQEEKDIMMDMYLKLIKSGKSFILDRSWYSEMVYGEIMRDSSYINEDQMLALEYQVLFNGGGLIVHCSDTTWNLWDRCQTRGEDYITDYNTLDKINKKFNEVFDDIEHIIPVVRYSIPLIKGVVK